MKITVSKSPKFDTHIVFLTKEYKIKPKDFEGKKDEITVRYEHKKTVIYCGLGEQEKCTGALFRAAAATGIRKAMGLKRKNVSLIEPKLKGLKKTSALALLEGTMLGSYTFSKYKSKKPDRVDALEVVSETISNREVKNAAALCENTCYARNLVNENASEIIPERLAKEARTIANQSNAITYTILTEKEIKQKGLNLLYAVGQGSPYPPRLIFMNYRGNRQSKEKTAIVGKGITFDSGGQNLKPSKHIETMRCDMAGAAAVLGIMKTLCLLKPKVNVLGVIAAAHNAIDGKSYFPGVICKLYSGITVEILYTDAEGRLALADGISYCIKHFRPTEIIDLATLTGSIITAIGDTIAGLFSNNDTMADKLFKAGERTGERLWRMPLYDEHRESMKSDTADLRNISKMTSGHAGSITAAAFLESFVEGLPWVHLDIAGTAFNEGETRGEVVKLGTGFGVRLLMDYVTQK